MELLPTSRGMSVVEVLLAAALFGIIVTTFIGAIIFGTESAALAGHRARAVLLAHEGIEAARSIRGDDITQLSAGTYGVALSANEYAFSGVSDTTDIFTRAVTIESIDAQRARVTSAVTWQQNAQRTGTVTLVSRLTDWAKEVAGIGDWTNPAEEAAVGIAGNDNGWKVAVQGDYAYIVRQSGSPNFIVVDISNPASPSTVGTLSLSGGPEDVVVSGDYAHVSSDSNSQELQIIDVSTPSNPTLAGTFNNPGNSDMWSVYVVGTTAYLGRDSSGGDEFIAVNVAVPVAPVLLGGINIGSDVNDIVVEGNYAYLATDGTELQVVDVSNPLALTIAGSLNLTSGDNGEALALAGDTLVMGRIGNTGRFHTIDVSTPTAPSLLDSYNIGDDIRHVDVTPEGEYAFIAGDGNSGEFVVLDISDPSSIVFAASVDVSGDLNGVAYSSDHDRAVAVGDDNTDEVRIFMPQ